MAAPIRCVTHDESPDNRFERSRAASSLRLEGESMIGINQRDCPVPHRRSIRHGARCRLFGGFISVEFLLFSQQLVAVEISSFHERVLATYNFSPHFLTNEEISAKSNNLHPFWT